MIQAILFSIAFMIQVQAAEVAWTGHWLGSGTLTDPKGKKSTCGTMQMLMREDRVGRAVSFYLPVGFPDCGQPSVLRSAMTLEVQGRELFLDGERAGEFSGGEFRVVRSTDWGSFFFKEDVLLTRNARRELVYRKILTVIDEGVYVIEGTLAPVN